MPNRRRRRLSTAMSAVAALAVASPAAIVAVSDLSENAKPPTQHRQFVQAAMITDLPNELMSALSQGLSQFGINLPPLPTSLFTGSGSSTPTTLTTPGLGTAPLTTPGLGTSPLTTPGSGNLSADHAQPRLPHRLTTAPATLPDATLTNPALTPALTSPVGALPAGCDAASRPDHAACGHRSVAHFADLQRGGPARPGRGADLGAHRAGSRCGHLPDPR